MSILDKKVKALMIRVTPEEHKYIKVEAAKRGITVSDMVKRSLMRYVERFTVE